MRHSAANVMLNHGVPLKVVSGILGHSSIAVTGDVYGHVAPDVSRDALDILGDVLGSKGGLTVVAMVVKPPRRAVRGRSGSLRIRPLICGFTVGLTGFEPATP